MRRILLLLILIFSIPIFGQLILGSVPRQPPIINADNVTDLQMIERFGQGNLNEVLVFSPINDNIAVGSERGIYLYDNLESEPQLIELYREDSSPFNVTSLLYSSDGNWIFAGSDEETLTDTDDGQALTDYEEIIAYDLIEQRVLYRFVGNTPHAISNDNSMLAYETETAIHISDLDTGELLFDLSYEERWVSKVSVSFSGRNISNVHFNADDTQLIVDWFQAYGLHFGDFDYKVDLWQLLDEPSYTSILDARDYITGTWYTDFRSAPNGLEYAVEDDVFTTANTQFALLPESVYIPLNSMVTTSDMLTFALPYWNDQRTHLQVGIWNAETGNSLANITVSPRSQLLLKLNNDASLIADGLDIYDVASGELLRQLRVDEYRVIYGSEHIAHYGEDNSIRILDTDFNELVTLPITQDELRYLDGVFNNILPVYSRVGDESVIHQISLDTGDLLGEIRYDWTYRPSYTSANYNYLVTTGANSQIWDFATSTLIELPDNTFPISPYFTANERAILWHEENSELWIYDLVTSDVIRVPVPQADDSEIRSPFGVDLSLDETALLLHISTENHHSIFYVWDISETQPSLRYEGQANGFDSDLSSDGRYVAINTTDNEIQVIDTVTGIAVFRPSIERIGSFVQGIILDDSLLKIRFNWWEDFIVYDWETGEPYEGMSSPVEEQRPILTTDTMLFYNDHRILRITTTDQVGLRDIDLGRVFSTIRLSEDQQRLWIGFADGILELWMLQS